MIKVQTPWARHATCVMYHETKNIMVRRSMNQHIIQQVSLEEFVDVDDGIVERCCFEATFLGKTFLLVIDGSSVYEISKSEEGIKTYTKSKRSWVYAEFYAVDDVFAIKGKILYYHQVAPNYLTTEIFFFQANFMNQEYIRNLFEGVLEQEHD